MDQPVVIVTGASHGLGAATAHILSESGAGVVLAARSPEDLQLQARQIEQSGGAALPVGADLSRESDCRDLVSQTLERFGRIDALINNAGTVEPIGLIAQAHYDQWQESWAVNVLGPVILAQAALPALRERNGRIVNLTSGSTENVVGGWGAYSAAKAALNHLTRVLAKEEPAVTSLALRPGLVDTEMQAVIREKGKGRMAEANYRWLVGLYEKGQLLPPEVPGRALACLALYAPREWSGEVILWDEPRVEQLVMLKRF